MGVLSSRPAPTEILGTVYAAHTARQAAALGPRREASRPCTTGSSQAGGYLREVSTAGRAPTGSPVLASTPRSRADVGTSAVVRAVGGRAPGDPRARRSCWTCPSCRSSASPAPMPGGPGPGVRRRGRRRSRRITYTQWLDDAGHLEADLTVTKLAEGDFWVVASDTAHGHALARMRRYAGDADVTIADVTTGVRPAQRAGSAVARPAGQPSPTPTSRPRRSPSARLAGSRSRAAKCCWSGSRTSGSWATRSTCRPPTR